MKDKIIFLILGFIIVVLIVFIVVFNSRGPDKSENNVSTTTVLEQIQNATTTNTQTSREDESTASGARTTSKHHIPGNVMKSEKTDKGYHIVGDDENINFGLTNTILEEYSNEPNLYYFTDGYFDSSITGIIFCNLDDNYYYVENGMANLDYSGLAEKDGYMWLIENGQYQEGFFGEKTIDGVTYSFANGCVE